MNTCINQLGKLSSFGSMNHVNHAKRWVEEFVIGYTLCPFAKVPYEAGQVRFCEITETETELILEAFWKEVEVIDEADEVEISNSILVIPSLTDSFDRYLDVLYLATDLLEMQNKSDKLQLASFHPEYQFDGTTSNDPTNYTNRSPVPLIHFIRIAEVARAIESHPDIDSVPIANQAKMRELGEDHLKGYLETFE